MKALTYVCAVLLCFVALSCKKNKENPKPDPIPKTDTVPTLEPEKEVEPLKLLTKIIYNDGDRLLVTSIDYNEKKLIDHTTYSLNDEILSTNHYFYDDDKNLTRMEGRTKSNHSFVYIFKYTNNLPENRSYKYFNEDSIMLVDDFRKYLVKNDTIVGHEANR